MNWLDIAILALVLASVISSIISGLTREIVSLAALILGILVGLWWYPEVARHLEQFTSSPAVAGFAAFFLILIGFVLLGWVVTKILSALIKASGLRWFDRVLGAAFGLLRGLLASAALVLAVVAFLPGKGTPRTVAESRLAPAVLYGARLVVAAAPRSIKESFENGLKRIQEVWREARSDTV